MQYLFLGVTASLIVLGIISLHHYLLLRRSLARLKEELTALRKVTGTANAATPGFAEPWVRMMVEIKDPIALAHRESKMAQMASSTAPHLVVKKVYEQVMAETKERLGARNIDAEVSLIVL